jgi:hypothetical protein
MVRCTLYSFACAGIESRISGMVIDGPASLANVMCCSTVAIDTFVVWSPSRRVVMACEFCNVPWYIYTTFQLSAIQQPQKAQLSHLPWRNWLARSTVRFGFGHLSYREVDSSSLSGRASFWTFFTPSFLDLYNREACGFLGEEDANSRTRLVGWSQATMRGVLLVFVDCGELCWGYHVQIVVDFVESKLHV